jgi:hypothetical protein
MIKLKDILTEAEMNPVKKVVNAILKTHGVNAMKTTSTSVRGFHNIVNNGYSYDGNNFLRFYKVSPGVVEKVADEIQKAGVRVYSVNKSGTIKGDFSKTGLVNESLNEACWDGYKQVGMKKKGDRQVPNCVPVNENETQSVECEECGWEWDLSDGGKDPYLCHKCGHDNTDDYEELDVEDEDEEDFINFLKGYTTEINEAEYQGREVKLGKPMQGDVKKFKVYVKNPTTGKIIKVNFGHGGTSAAAAGEETMRIRKSNPDARKAFRARHNCDEPGPRTKARYWSCKKW